jgi:hypothetical protein
MELYDLIQFAEAYNHLGWAVQEQLADLCNGNAKDINPHALDLMQEKLQNYHKDLDELLESAAIELKKLK